MNKSEIAVLTEVDTRALTREIRSQGVMGGVITDNLDHLDWLIKKAAKASQALQGDLVQYVTRRNTMVFGQGKPRIVLLDLGTKRGVIHSLVRRGCEVIAVPANTEAWEIMNLSPNGVFVSDGPGIPRPFLCYQSLPGFAGNTSFRGWVGTSDISHRYGSTDLSFAMRTSRHQPSVRDLETGRIYITTQNHGYAIDESSLTKTGLEVTMRSLNDGSIEGIRHQSLNIFSVQFDPESYPDYSETGFLR